MGTRELVHPEATLYLCTATTTAARTRPIALAFQACRAVAELRSNPGVASATSSSQWALLEGITSTVSIVSCQRAMMRTQVATTQSRRTTESSKSST